MEVEVETAPAPVVLENWGLVGHGGGVRVLSDHPFKPGLRRHTSRVEAVDLAGADPTGAGAVITTASGSLYTLGVIDPAFLRAWPRGLAEVLEALGDLAPVRDGEVR